MPIRAVNPSAVNLLVLASLMEAPMHPYEIQRLAVERDKTSIQGVKRGSIYHAVQKLEAAGLIEATESQREGRRPERTVYRLTDLGQDEAKQWLINLLRRPSGDTRSLVTALEFIPMLTTAQAQTALEYRGFQLDREIGGLRASLASVTERLPRVFIIELEYTLVMKDAERAWVAAIVAQIQSGEFAWSREAIDAWAAQSSFSSGLHHPESEAQE